MDLINDMFEQRDANIILSIPLDAEKNDTWYWRREKMGHYSVKSAYMLLQEPKMNAQNESNSGF